MPFLIYRSKSDDAIPTFAINDPDPIDEIMLQDISEWGWRVEERADNDPHWLSTIQKYHARFWGKGENEDETGPSLWKFWQEENARRLVEGTEQKNKTPNKLVKRKSTSKSDQDSQNGKKKAQRMFRRRKVSHELAQEAQGSENDGITREIERWDGRGILRTQSFSVASEAGVCVDARGEQVYRHPPWRLGLLPWEERELDALAARETGHSKETGWVAAIFSKLRRRGR